MQTLAEMPYVYVYSGGIELCVVVATAHENSMLISGVTQSKRLPIIPTLKTKAIEMYLAGLKLHKIFQFGSRRGEKLVAASYWLYTSIQLRAPIK